MVTLHMKNIIKAIANTTFNSLFWLCNDPVFGDIQAGGVMLTQQASIWLTLMFDSAISSAVIAGGLWNMTKVLPFICNAIRSVENDWIVKLRKTFANTGQYLGPWVSGGWEACFQYYPSHILVSVEIPTILLASGGYGVVRIRRCHILVRNLKQWDATWAIIFWCSNAAISVECCYHMSFEHLLNERQNLKILTSRLSRSFLQSPDL